MMTSLTLIMLMVFMIWPESKVKLESVMSRKTPRLHILTFRSVERYHADVARRYPDRRKLNGPR